MPYCKIKDVDLFYEDIGVGEPILFLHSHYNRGIIAFACQIQAFNKQYRCILPDYRGHGRTICENLTWDSGMMVKDMVDFLDSLGLEKVHVVGYSAGGSIGFHLAVEFPQYVASLVSIGCDGFPFAESVHQFLPENLIKNEQFDFIEQMNNRHFDAHRGNWQEFMRQSAIDNDKYPNLSKEQLSSIKAPVFIIVGENDTLIKQEQVVEAQNLIPNCQTFVVPNGGHNVHMLGEHTITINNIIDEFHAKNHL
jgi:Predicted hydrolases or acyltransferases (alpha/beta hydrolase superfamily)